MIGSEKKHQDHIGTHCSQTNHTEEGARFLLTLSVSAAAAVTGNESWFVGGGNMVFFKESRIRYCGALQNGK